MGKVLHLGINGYVGDLIELIVILFVLLIAFSLITGTTLEQIRDFLEGSLPENTEPKTGLAGLLDLKDKFGKNKEDELKIVGSGEATDEQETLFKEDTKEPEIAEEMAVSIPPEPRVEDVDTSKVKTDSDNLNPQEPKFTNWVFPEIDLLQNPEIQKQNKDLYRQKAKVIEATLKSFGIESKVVEIAVGPNRIKILPQYKCWNQSF